MDLSNKEIELLKQAQNKSSVPSKKEDYYYLFKLGKEELIKNNLNLSKDGNLIPESYFLTDKGKYQLELLDTHKQHERKIHVSYPIFVNLLCGFIGFIAGWIVRSFVHFPLFH